MFFVFKQIATAARSNNQGIVKKKLGGHLSARSKYLLQLQAKKTAAVKQQPLWMIGVVVQVGWQ